MFVDVKDERGNYHELKYFPNKVGTIRTSHRISYFHGRELLQQADQVMAFDDPCAQMYKRSDM